jgi:hypothetical protein
MSMVGRDADVRSDPGRPANHAAGELDQGDGHRHRGGGGLRRGGWCRTGASLTFVGIAGDLVLRVPAGSRVREGGFSLLGDRQIQVAAGDGPEIQVKVYGLFSDVKVTDQPR